MFTLIQHSYQRPSTITMDAKAALVANDRGMDNFGSEPKQVTPVGDLQ